MSCHSHDHDHAVHERLTLEKIEDSKIRKKLIRVLYISSIFMIIEFVSGMLANSLALISDSVHMLTDVIALLLSLFVFWIARRPRTAAMSFGYYRAEILGALGSGLGLWFICGLMIYESILRLRAPPYVQGPIVFWIGLIGMIINWISMKVLHGGHQSNLNLRAAYLHIFSDFLGSIGAIIAGLVLWFTGWLPIDPILTIVFTLLIFNSSWKMIKESIDILMERFPKHINPEKLSEDLKRIEGVEDIHDLHVWSLSSGRIALSVHLISKKAESVLLITKELLKEKYAITNTTIQIESPESHQSDPCIHSW